MSQTPAAATRSRPNVANIMITVQMSLMQRPNNKIIGNAGYCSRHQHNIISIVANNECLLCKDAIQAQKDVKTDGSNTKQGRSGTALPNTPSDQLRST